MPILIAVLVMLVFILGIVVIINPLFLAKIITRLEGAFLIVNTLITILLARRVKTYMLVEK